jgi:hypothetical protein
MTLEQKIQEYCENWPVTRARLSFSRRRQGQVIVRYRNDLHGQIKAEKELLSLVTSLLHSRCDSRCEGSYEQER